MLSQNNESEIIANFFGSHVGTFIDIGAGAGVALSNTFELGLKGWRGVLVEASPIQFAQLLTNYHHRGGFQFVNAALWHQRMMMEFYLHPGFLSSLVPTDSMAPYLGRYWVQTITARNLWNIATPFLGDVDFISLDIEGADILVFPSLVDQFPQCRLWAVEHGKDEVLKGEWQELFTIDNLRIVAETTENYLIAP